MLPGFLTIILTLWRNLKIRKERCLWQDSNQRPLDSVSCTLPLGDPLNTVSVWDLTMVKPDMFGILCKFRHFIGHMWVGNPPTLCSLISNLYLPISPQQVTDYMSHMIYSESEVRDIWLVDTMSQVNQHDPLELRSSAPQIVLHKISVGDLQTSDRL